MKKAAPFHSVYLRMCTPSEETSNPKCRVAHRNELDEKTILSLLGILQRKLRARRGRKTTLVVHGGVIAVLVLKCRRTTSDVDYIERVLPEELGRSTGGTRRRMSSISRMIPPALGGPRIDVDARAVIHECIAETAAEFNAILKRPFVLEDTWMNSEADAALPWHLNAEYQMTDPVVMTALTEADEEHTIYDSPGLRLLGITSTWTFALKLQRFTPSDESDLVYLLRQDGAYAFHQEKDFLRMVENRLRVDCRAMEYEHFTKKALIDWRLRLLDCVRKATFLNGTRPHLSLQLQQIAIG